MEPTTTSIEVLAKTTADNLRIKNEEFLTKYPTDDAQIDYYTKLAMQVFDEFEIDGSYAKAGTRKNVETWFANKQTLFALLRKHPYWNEEAKSIVFTQNELRVANYSNAKSKLADLMIYVKDKLNEGSRFDKVIEAIYYTLVDLIEDCYKSECVITQEFIDKLDRRITVAKLPKPIKRMVAKGTKITKLVHKCFTMWTKASGEVVDATTLVDDHEEGARYYNSFDKLYAKFADTLSELTIKKITLVSLHFCDYLLMSNGNSWSSCHYINSHNIFHEENTSSYSGCYKQGCLSYALDEPSFLFYTLPNTYDGEEYYRQQKINRMCCQYKEGIIITGKCYPNNEDAYITRYRQTLQLIFSTVEEVPNLWTFSRKTKKISAFVETEEDSAHYRDYECENQKPTISVCKHFGLDLDKTMTIGHEAYCVHCGKSLYGTDTRQLQCSKHLITPKCPICGRRIEEGEEHYIIDGKMYHPDCCFFCAFHGEYEPNSWGKHELTLTDDSEIIVCDDAFDKYICCEKCGKWLRRRDAHWYNDDNVCPSCYRELIAENPSSRSFTIEPLTTYNVGDYVLVKEEPQRGNRYGTNGAMIRDFAGKIARIARRPETDGYYLTIDGHNWPWIWSSGAFEGKLVGNGINDSLLGRRMEEVC